MIVMNNNLKKILLKLLVMLIISIITEFRKIEAFSYFIGVGFTTIIFAIDDFVGDK